MALSFDSLTAAQIAAGVAAGTVSSGFGIGNHTFI